jgi:gas vesicle protein
MRDHDDLPYIVIEKHSGGGMGTFLWGALLGAGVALLLAPRSGEETQEEIRERVERLREAAEDRVNEVRDTVTESVSRTRDRIQDQIDSVRDTVETAPTARARGGHRPRAARDARSELERRVAEARENAADACTTRTSRLQRGWSDAGRERVVTEVDHRGRERSGRSSADRRLPLVDLEPWARVASAHG